MSRSSSGSMVWEGERGVRLPRTRVFYRQAGGGRVRSVVQRLDRADWRAGYDASDLPRDGGDDDEPAHDDDAAAQGANDTFYVAEVPAPADSPVSSDGTPLVKARPREPPRVPSLGKRNLSPVSMSPVNLSPAAADVVPARVLIPSVFAVGEIAAREAAREAAAEDAAQDAAEDAEEDAAEDGTGSASVSVSDGRVSRTDAEANNSSDDNRSEESVKLRVHTDTGFSDDDGSYYPYSSGDVLEEYPEVRLPADLALPSEVALSSEMALPSEVALPSDVAPLAEESLSPPSPEVMMRLHPQVGDDASSEASLGVRYEDTMGGDAARMGAGGRGPLLPSVPVVAAGVQAPVEAEVEVSVAAPDEAEIEPAAPAAPALQTSGLRLVSSRVSDEQSLVPVQKYSDMHISLLPARQAAMKTARRLQELPLAPPPPMDDKRWLTSHGDSDEENGFESWEEREDSDPPSPRPVAASPPNPAARAESFGFHIPHRREADMIIHSPKRSPKRAAAKLTNKLSLRRSPKVGSAKHTPAQAPRAESAMAGPPLVKTVLPGSTGKASGSGGRSRESASSRQDTVTPETSNVMRYQSELSPLDLHLATACRSSPITPEANSPRLITVSSKVGDIRGVPPRQSGTRPDESGRVPRAEIEYLDDDEDLLQSKSSKPGLVSRFRQKRRVRKSKRAAHADEAVVPKHLQKR